jgi:hypothetical protein
MLHIMMMTMLLAKRSHSGPKPNASAFGALA